ncbi:MAG: glycosyltransferase family 1 protein [Verrucomicrobiota bacterium]
MKITFVTDTYAPQLNGVANTLRRLVEELRQQGHEVDVIRPSVLASDEIGMQVPSVALPGYPEVRVGFPIGLILQARWFRNRPDVIYVATETPLGTSAINAARALDIPVASGFHTNFQQYVAHYQLPLLERATMTYLRHVHNRSDCTFAPTPDTIEELERQGFCNLELLPRGVDTDKFAPKRRDPFLRRQWGASDGSLVGIFVGRIAAEKNLPLVIRTFSELKRRYPDFCGVFVGDGPKLEELKRTHPEFVYVGPQFGEELGRYYASADVFVFPSMTETFGNVTLEAMASGLAVVAYHYVAARQHIVDEENGFTAPFGDDDAFVEKAVHAARLPTLPEVREEARNSALKVRWEKVAKRFESNLKDLVGKDTSLPSNQATTTLTH